MDESDLRVRLAACAFLDEQRKLSSDLFERRTLQRGFELDGERVPLQGPQGIFKPRLCQFPLSITTVPVTQGQPRPYDDALGVDIPADVIRRRYSAGLNNFFRLYRPLASTWRLYDASGREPRMIAHQVDVGAVQVYDKQTWERIQAQNQR